MASGNQAGAEKNPLSFITEPFQKTFECLFLDCNRVPPPPSLALAQSNCELQKVAQKCDQITQKNPDDAKYIRSCTLEKICQRQLLPTDILRVEACFRGAAEVYADYKKYFLDVADRIEQENEELKKCQDVACKRDRSKGIPEFDHMDNATLGKYPITYIDLKVKDYRNYMSSYLRAEAANKYYRENTGLKRFNENQSNNRQAPHSLEFDYIDAGKNFLKKAGVILECYDQQAYSEILCHAILKTALPFAVFKGGVMTIRSVASVLTAQVERRGWIIGSRFIQENERSFIRQLFLEKHGFQKFTSKAENQLMMDAATSSVPVAGRVFIRIENGILKYLNKFIGDKRLITSINNKYNEILFRRMAELKKKFPDVDFNPYQGFKEVEYMVTTKNGQPLPSNFLNDVDKMFQDANKELKDHLQSNSILRASDQPDTWYRAGVGRTGDMANAAARESRDDLTQNVLVNFDDPKVIAKLQASIGEGRKLASELAQSFSGTEMVSTRDGVTTLNADVMGLVRKYPESVDLRQALQNKYPGQTIDVEHIDKLKKLYEIQDRFSPPVRFAEREIASFTNGKGTQVGIDFVNAGGANAEGQLRALSQSQTSQQMLQSSRTHFEIATSELNRKKDQFSKICEKLVAEHNASLPPGGRPITVSVAKSGDDGVADFSEVLTQKQKDWIAKEWARRENEASKPSSSARISIPNELVTDLSQKNILAAHGENIEKELRTLVTGQISNRNLDGFVAKVEMKGFKSGMGSVDLSIAFAPGRSLTSDEILLIKNRFAKALKEINSNPDGVGTFRYRMGDVRIIPGD